MASNPPDFRKIALRAAMRRRRRIMARACPDASIRAAGHFPAGAAPHGAVAALYQAMGAELDPGMLIQILTQRGVAAALPVVVDRQRPLVFRVLRPADLLSPDPAGIPAPPTEAPEVVPDVMVVPMLAFDRAGGRLGQGGGFYDRTIAALRAKAPLLVIGLAYAGQEVPAVPREPHDEPVDAILTESGYIEV